MKLHDAELEIQALRTLCARSSKPDCAKLMARLDQDFFHLPHSKRIHRRIKAAMKSRGSPPSWSALAKDPALPEATRKHMKMYRGVGALPAKATAADYEGMYESLRTYWQGRSLWEDYESGLKELEKDSPDIPRLLDDATETLASLRLGGVHQKALRLSGGKDDTSKDEFDDLMSDKAPQVIPTGFKEFDDRNGGLLRGSLVVLAAPTGAGKTSQALQLALNVVRHNDCYQVCIIPLEMDRRQMLARIYSNLSGVPKSRILAKLMSPQERKKLRLARKRLAEELAKRESSLDVDDQGNVSMEDALNIRAAHGDDMTIVDQLTLMSDAAAGNDRQWAAMGEACRLAKLDAVKNNKVNVVLTQLDDVGNVKYSRAVLEHADLAFVWGKDEDTQNGKAAMEVHTRKARHQEAVSFTLDVDVGSGLITDSDAAPSADSGPKRARVGKRRGKAEEKVSVDGDLDEYLGDESS